MFFILLNSKQWCSHLTQWCSREQKRIFFISFHFWRIFPHPRLIPTTSGEGSPNYRLILPFRGWSVVTNETSYFLFPIVFWNRLLTTEDFRKILFFSPSIKIWKKDLSQNSLTFHLHNFVASRNAEHCKRWEWRRFLLTPRYFVIIRNVQLNTITIYNINCFFNNEQKIMFSILQKTIIQWKVIKIAGVAK